MCLFVSTMKKVLSLLFLCSFALGVASLDSKYVGSDVLPHADILEESEAGIRSLRALRKKGQKKKKKDKKGRRNRRKRLRLQRRRRNRNGGTAIGADASIVDLLEARGDEFSILADLVDLADLDSVLDDALMFRFGSRALQEAGEGEEDDGMVTLFAPTNAAFLEILDGIEKYTDLEAWGKSFLRGILTYHVLDKLVLSTDLKDNEEIINTASLIPNGVTVFLDPPRLEGPTIAKPANIVEVDNIAANGVFHVIDKVLTPAFAVFNVIDVAASNENFSIFFELLTIAELVPILQNEGPFSVYAVPNAVFQGTEQALAAQGLTGFIDKLKQDPDLREILLNHIVFGKIVCGCEEDTVITEAELPLTITDVTETSFKVNGIDTVPGQNRLIVSNAIISTLTGINLPPGLPTFLNP